MNLSHKIDFIGVIIVDNCNPNGDPLNGNRPRQSIDGYGLISQECLKRKIRNRLQEMGEEIFVQSNDKITDGFGSLKQRYESFIKIEKKKLKSFDEYDKTVKKVSKKWIDVRSFGQVFAYEGGSSVSIGVRGPVSISEARSIEIVDIIEHGIANSANNLTYEKKDSGTMGLQHVTSGVYVFRGGIYPQLAEKTGFSEEDAEKIKQALLKMYYNDASNSRPSGSIGLGTLLWFSHDSRDGSVSPLKLIHSVKVTPQKDWPYYTIEETEKFDGVTVERYDMI